METTKLGVLWNLKYWGHIFLRIEGRNTKTTANGCIQGALLNGRLALVALVTWLPW